jgi:Rps23 Pro-64 3,4-dihydroxylase Tpa1-like proline 4-hydroxylase
VGDGTVDGDSQNSAAERAIKGVSAAIQALSPGSLYACQSARYTKGCFIEPHDDLAYKVRH